MTWADEYRTLQVRCNAETPCDAQRAKLFGAEGIGLVRTEHMFFEGERIVAMRQMILAADEKERQSALQKLLEMQRQDFADLFEIFPSVTVRLLDAPLHEFLPSTEAGLAAVAAVGARVPASLERVKRRTAELREANPMLGHRGCRLAITYPEICQMQTRAIFEAVASLGRRQQVPTVEVMVPLVSHVEEFKILKLVVEKTVLAVQREQGMSFKYHIGAMVELPRACLQAEKLAQSAEFFSFGSNDLTQSTYGLSRDDASTFLPDYKAKGILEQDPFVTLDTEGVGELILLAVERGRKARSGMKMGICGEHGGDPGSIDFCNRIGLDYVSCSPWRAPLARLAAAQAALRADHGDGDRAKRNGTRHRCQSKRVFEAAIGSQGDGAQRIQKGDQGRPPGEVIYDPMDCQFYTWQLAIAQNLGGRRTQEDRLAVCPCLGDWNKAFFGLWDGAVDDFAAEEVRKLFLSNLIASSAWAKVSNSNPDPEALQDCLREAIQTTDQEVIRLCRDTQNHYSSCTGVMTLWTGTILTVAHVGDSRATLGYVEDGLVGYEQLTSDHK
ncbi:unnamed protein product [Cladocopium goreaui]|uniref:Pyruvate, phosphate dikinase (Pyruvate, orthophosphate dikinase) n=1 Tax=Cladocopium goreaui TaxID=2562237 RepID=A0A9P1BSV9_9DINO|nr:unnamed protein product [Cladocopium goreaui]